VASGNGEAVPTGLFIRGTLLGRKPARKFTFADGGEGLEPAKIGVATEHGEYSIAAGTDEQLSALSADWVKGDDVEVPVEIKAWQGQVKYYVLGSRGGGSWR